MRSKVVGILTGVGLAAVAVAISMVSATSASAEPASADYTTQLFDYHVVVPGP